MAIVTPRELLTLPALVAAAKATQGLIRLAPDGRRRVFDAAAFDGLADLAASWLTMRRELDQVLDHGAPIPRFREVHARYTVVDAWKTYILYGYGWRVEQTCAECPETARLLAAVPGMRTAMFSILPPGTHLPPHVGIYAGVLRYHLGLRVPEPERCGIRIGRQQIQWREGEGFVFDNTYEHEAWNRGEQARVVLFLDFDRPLPRRLARVNRWIIDRISATQFMRDSRKNLDAFYARNRSR